MSRMLSVAALLLAAAVAAAGEEPPVPVPLPQMLADGQGMNWDIQQDGSIGDGGNDQYDGGGHLYIGGAQWQSQGQALLYRRQNEVVIGPSPAAGLQITRRIAVDAQAGFCRWAEVLENPGAQPIRTEVRLYFNMGNSISTAQPFNEEKGQKRQIGVVLGETRQHYFGVLAGGRNSKVLGDLQPQPNSDTFNIIYNIEVPPKKAAVIVHVHFYRRSQAEAMQALEETKEKLYIAALPRELQKAVVNFRRADMIGGDLEILRGTTLDVVELRGGDQVRGDLRSGDWKLNTPYGAMEIPSARLLGLINVGQYRPRQLLVTADGEVFGGSLEGGAVGLRLSSGQEMDIPLARITRAGWRLRSTDPEELPVQYPMAFLRSGDRVRVEMPREPIAVSTRFGALKLAPTGIAALVFQAEENPVHEIHLVDGSRITGIVTTPQFSLKLASGYCRQSTLFPAGAVLRLQLAAVPDDAGEGKGTLRTSSGDSLVGSLDGRFTIETAFDAIQVNAREVKAMAYRKGSPGDVIVTLWDESIVLGRLKEGQVSFATAAGGTLAVPVSLIEEYAQPRPEPADAVTGMIRELTMQLNDDDWRKRDLAQQKLTTMGPIAINPLRRLRAEQSPEAQQRIDLILKALEVPPKQP